MSFQDLKIVGFLSVRDFEFRDYVGDPEKCNLFKKCLSHFRTKICQILVKKLVETAKLAQIIMKIPQWADFSKI
jgi:hypothetical protein